MGDDEPAPPPSAKVAKGAAVNNVGDAKAAAASATKGAKAAKAPAPAAAPAPAPAAAGAGAGAGGAGDGGKKKDKKAAKAEGAWARHAKATGGDRRAHACRTRCPRATQPPLRRPR